MLSKSPSQTSETKSRLREPLRKQIGSVNLIHSNTNGDETTNPDRILLLDAQKNASVVFARALAEGNIDITVGGWSRLAPGMLSRHVEDSFLYPSPYQYPKQFIDELTEHLRVNDYLAVVPITDLSHVLLAKHKSALEATGTAIGTEDWETFTTANNKKQLAVLLEDLSVPGPHTSAPDSLDDVAALRDEFSYPVLIKPQYTTVSKANGTYTEARISDENYVDSPDCLASQYRSLVEKYHYLQPDLPIIQEMIPGTVTATCGLADSGEFVEYFQEERLRMYPVEGGSSSLRRGIREPKMAENAEKIVRELDWTGPIYIEFIQSEAGEFHVLEVNGRYWGSLGCAICGGVNIPLLHYQQLKDVQFTPSGTYKTGVKQRRLFYTDIKWLGAQIEAGNYRAAIPFLQSFSDADHDVLAVDDPLPTVGAILWALEETVTGAGPTVKLREKKNLISSYVLGSITAYILDLFRKKKP